jgi:hypothetical protein
MDPDRFDTLVKSVVTRRSAVALVGGFAAVAGRAGLGEAAPGRRRCLKAGAQCDTNRQCCPKETGRICKQPNPPSGSEVCCSPKGQPCGGENQNGPVKPQCCQGFMCSSKKGGKCR